MNRILYFSVMCVVLTFLASCHTVKETRVSMKTDKGEIILKLYDATPLHKANFIKLAEEGFYDSLLFHRVINDFMIQGGAPDSKYAPSGAVVGMGEDGDAGYTIPNEFDSSIAHKPGVLAAARDDNPERASSGSQFYIVEAPPLTAEQIKDIEKRFNGSIPEAHKAIYMEQGGTPHLWLLEFTAFGEVVEGMDVVHAIADVPTDQMARPQKDIRILSTAVYVVKVKKPK